MGSTGHLVIGYWLLAIAIWLLGYRSSIGLFRSSHRVISDRAIGLSGQSSYRIGPSSYDRPIELLIGPSSY
jgi:hypothetical protein